MAVWRSRPTPSASIDFECIATSQDVRDRGSIFAHAVHAHVKNVVHGSKPATHEVAAWRCMVLKPGRAGWAVPTTSSCGPAAWTTQSSMREQGLKVMQEESTIDAVVIVSRWYGGVMLGPIRFAHFETCAREVCRPLDLAKSTASTSDAAPTTKKAPNYDSLKESLDIGRAKRLVTARENAIKSVKAALKKQQEACDRSPRRTAHR
ncbi:uncharacterized protein B0H18DRAFT_1086273 [Fomitopsis serialis]|uniref:uncharacterized protein n=1 Tax=Fomitopsis serialis TaxID=139415 RepID=UPI002008A94B|nr:uncharacterized protein B0H18DRAFT_1086273 [Neoantrodia serialis]KAH9920929.1 hypothetical protein B0H18DRAFT_1086273 [Neoantrodia serialis]